MMTFFATCARGCEDLLAQELIDLKFQDVQRQSNGVQFSGEEMEGFRACLWSGVASRILLPMTCFKAPDAAQVYAGASDVPWEDHLSSTSTFSVWGLGGNESIRHSGFLALKVKDAIVDRLRRIFGRRPNVDREHPEIRIIAAMEGNDLTLSFDLSGEGLHQRGWRLSGGIAPLKENLAASILRASGYTGETDLVDPMCGSGTLLIEAGNIALGLAPGRKNTFGFERWPNFNVNKRRTFSELRRESSVRKRSSGPAIVGYDKDAEMIRLSLANSVRADMNGVIRLETREIRRLRVERPETLIVTNPPYGERLMPNELEALNRLYEEMGRAFKDSGAQRASVFCANQGFRKAFKLKPSDIRYLYNGPIKAPLYAYPLRGGSEEREEESE